MTTPTNAEPVEYRQAIERNFKWNFIVNALDGATYWFGYSFIAPTIILPLFVSHFTDNPLLIGIIPILGTSGFLLPQLFTSNYVSRSPLKKFWPVNVGFFTERVPVLLFTLSTLLFSRSHPTLALVLFFLFLAWYNFGAGVIVVGWQDMIGKIIPADRRGRFFGITNFVGNASGILGALAVPFVLESFEFPIGYVYAFSAATVLIFISWFALSLTREPPLATSKPQVSQMEYMRSLPAVIRRDPNFARYLIFQTLFTLSGMASGFLAVYAAKQWNLSDSEAGWYVIAMQIGQALSTLLFGFLADRKGHKLILELIAALAVISLVMSFAAPGPLWFFPIFFLRGAIFAGGVLSGVSIVLEFTHAEERPTYLGLANTLPGVAGVIAPLLGGWLAGWIGYGPMFILSGVIAAASFVVIRWVVRDPRHLNAAAAPENA